MTALTSDSVAGRFGALPAARDSLAEKIYTRLRLALISGEHEPGKMLNIRKLAAESNTSPTPAREAVMQLVREGALELRMGHQPRVPMLSVSRYLSIREVRVPLERLAAELAAVHITPATLEPLKKAHADFIAAESEGRWKDALDANKRFHFAIYEASRNPVLVKTIENLWLLIGPFITMQYPHVRRASMEVHPHLLIIDALERRSPGEAGDQVVHDLREGSFLLLQQLRQQEAAAAEAA